MSYSGTIKVGHGLLDEGGNNLRASMAAIESLHADLEQRTSDLKATWYAASSPDAVAWKAAHDDLGSLMLELSAFVGHFGKATHHANETQIHAEKARETMFG